MRDRSLTYPKPLHFYPFLAQTIDLLERKQSVETDPHLIVEHIQIPRGSTMIYIHLYIIEPRMTIQMKNGNM